MVSNGSHIKAIVDRSCRAKVYKLAQKLHCIGIVHKDLEPQNIMQSVEGRLCLINFSHSTKYTCLENMVTICDSSTTGQRYV